MTLDTKKVREAFDRMAPDWDKTRNVDEDLIEDILDAAAITGGVSVLDAACGTGVLFPFILERGVMSLTGSDLSPAMIRIAGKRHRDPRLTLIACDAEALPPARYDRIIIFNALPHFPDPARLISAMADRLAQGGRLTIAHDASRDAVNARHAHDAASISIPLPPASEVAALFAPRIRADTQVDSARCYIVSGTLVP